MLPTRASPPPAAKTPSSLATPRRCRTCEPLERYPRLSPLPLLLQPRRRLLLLLLLLPAIRTKSFGGLNRIWWCEWRMEAAEARGEGEALVGLFWQDCV